MRENSTLYFVNYLNFTYCEVASLSSQVRDDRLFFTVRLPNGEVVELPAEALDAKLDPRLIRDVEQVQLG